MKRLAAVLASCMILTACVSVERPASPQMELELTTDQTLAEEGSDFRNVSWGMTIDDVRSREVSTLKNEYIEEGAVSFLDYDTESFLGVPAEIRYTFRNE